jgi:hypothetical protein
LGACYWLFFRRRIPKTIGLIFSAANHPELKRGYLRRPHLR